VLRTVASRLADFAGGTGLVGRFGGDELLLIDLRNIERDEKKASLEDMYDRSGALRFNMDFENGSAYITATSGAAAFPRDADNFDDLFGQVDKMLYLGKSRGRNCFYVYDNKKYADIEISKLSAQGIFSVMQSVRNAMEKQDGIIEKLHSVTPIVAETLKVKDIYFIGRDGRMRAVNDSAFEADAKDIANLMEDDIFFDSTLEQAERECPVFYSALKENGFGSAMAATVKNENGVCGYLVVAVNRSLRIWQQDECAILYYLAGLLS
ncbi:MAG: diguanylate cyclase, partial [Lachnospiraceae bacterium]|nr:diguanylate cyclase [Lachnospiraceae bacterium]